MGRGSMSMRVSEQAVHHQNETGSAVSSSNMAAKDDNASIETTIQTMQTIGTCRSPVHWHSFRGAQVFVLRSSLCAACEKPVSSGLVSSLLPTSTPTIVQCVACSLYAHRSCAARRNLWGDHNKCQAVEEGTSLKGDAVEADLEPEGFDESPQIDEKATEIDDIAADGTSPTSENFSSQIDEKATEIDDIATDGTSPTSENFSSSDEEPLPAKVTRPQRKSHNRRATFPALQSQEKRTDDPPIQQEDISEPANIDHHIAMDPIDTSWEVTVAAFAGGMAGLMIAGPVGAAGGAIAAAAARQKSVQKRSLTLHNGVTVSVRPHIPTDPIWYNYVAQAIRTAPRQKSSSHYADADITAVTEDEMDPEDKILLLVHRTLNDATTRAGHVYRYLMAIYKDRLKQQAAHPRRRRDDVHSVVRHVTASVVEERPELGSSWTEVTATTVESLVFGELYDSVMEEIVEETCERDVELWRKISALEHESNQTAQELLEAAVSQQAIQALQMLPKSHSATEKLHFCVLFLDCVSKLIAETEDQHCSADSLLKAVCHHVVYLENSISSNAEISFLEEFSRDEALLRGREGYALVTLQACLQFLQVADLSKDVLDLGKQQENG